MSLLLYVYYVKAKPKAYIMYDIFCYARFHTVAFESPSLTEDLLVASHTKSKYLSPASPMKLYYFRHSRQHNSIDKKHKGFTSALLLH